MKKRLRQGARTVRVRVGRLAYPVWIGPGQLDRLGERLRQIRPECQSLFIVSSPRVWRIWGRQVRKHLRRVAVGSEILLIPDGEKSKRVGTVERLAERLLARRADRGAILAAVGGGVVGDVTGFLAASYMRGVDYLQIPTTLVGQVDSALGGKTGVNLAGGKNLLGAFHHPVGVVVDPCLLETLPERDYRSGLYEVVKYAILGDRSLFSYLERNLAAVVARDQQALVPVLARSIGMKARIVTKDEREAGLRRVLNLGHTFGHALEAVNGYGKLRHGEAVGWGLLAATDLARRTGRLSAADAERITRLVLSLGPLPRIGRLSPTRVYRQMFADKKRRSAVLHFVLPRKIGRVEIVSDLRRQDVLASLAALPRLAAPR